MRNLDSQLLHSGEYPVRSSSIKEIDGALIAEFISESCEGVKVFADAVGRGGPRFNFEDGVIVAMPRLMHKQVGLGCGAVLKIRMPFFCPPRRSAGKRNRRATAISSGGIARSNRRAPGKQQRHHG